jgi:hypothetical protein
MPAHLEVTVTSHPDDPIRMTRTETPDYLRRAIAAAIEQAKRENSDAVQLRGVSLIDSVRARLKRLASRS